MCLLVLFNLFIGYKKKYTFKNLKGWGQRKWSIGPLDAIITIFYAYGKNFRRFCIRFNLDPRSQLYRPKYPYELTAHNHSVTYPGGTQSAPMFSRAHALSIHVTILKVENHHNYVTLFEKA